MIRLDYWNNPLVIKALRVKYRGGRLNILASFYLLLLLAGLMTMHRYRANFGGPQWLHNYFIAMISLQLVISAVIAVSATASSIKSEVTTHTLDFQRIAGLSPTQILLGKALGEPASAYLFNLVTVPIAALCCTLGGVNVIIAALLYVTLVTSTFMMACIGLQHTLEPSEKDGRGSPIVLIIVLVPLILVPLWLAAAGLAATGVSRALTAPIGLLTPIPTIRAMLAPAPAGSAVWSTGLPLFGVDIPYIVLTPLVQIGVSAYALSIMARRLRSTLDTAVSKAMTYGVLILMDILWAGLYFDTIQDGPSLTAQAVRFAIGHCLFVLILSGQAAPSRESYQSWLWRLRGRCSPARDLLLGERTLNTGALAVWWCLGVLVFGLTNLVPVALSMPQVLPQTHWAAVAIAFTLSLLLIFCYGLFYQVLCVAAGKKEAGVVFFIVALITMGAPFAVGQYFRMPMVSSLSPMVTFARLYSDSANYYPPGPIIAAHLLGIGFWSWGLLGISRRLKRQVDRKLVAMGGSSL